MAHERELAPRAAIEGAATLGGTSSEQALEPLEQLGTAETGHGSLGTEGRVAATGGNHAAGPARIGRYVVLRRLGQGGMGVVYSAYDADLDRKVAIKMVHDSLQHSVMGRSRVLKEAQAMARIAHPNVVHVYEVGQDTGSPNSQVFIAMEFVPGLSLAQWQRRQRAATSIDEVMRLYLQAAAGLEAAHRSGLIHRDFKPDNVLVGEDGRARVVDFGLARALDGPQLAAPKLEGPRPKSGSGERLTEAGAVLGTPGYMAPEQVMGEEADARSDQFSYCVALYEALYQQLPFAGETIEEYSRNVLSGSLSALPQNRPAALEIPILLEQALRRGLSRDPAARFPSMEALITALRAGVRPDSDSQRARLRKRRVLLLGCGGMLAVAIFRMLTAPLTRDTNLRGVMIVGWVGFFIIVAFALGLRSFLQRQLIPRRGVYFFIILLGYIALVRTLGYVLHTPIVDYKAIECFSVGAIFAIEIPHVGKQYLWPTAVAVIGAALQVLWPEYGRLHGGLCYTLLAFLSAYLRPWSSQSTSENSPAA